MNRVCLIENKVGDLERESERQRERESKEQTASARNGTRKAKNQNHRPVLHNNTHLIGSLLKLLSMTQMCVCVFF